MTEWTGSTDYDMVAEVRGHEVLLYERYGSYQGDWYLLSFDPKAGAYSLWNGDYGSCSGCDSLEAESPGGSLEDVRKFSEAYSPFADVPRETARNLSTANTWLQVFAANGWQSDDDKTEQGDFARQVREVVMLREDLPITAPDILGARNAESRRLMLDRFGAAAFVEATNPEVLDSSEQDRLLRFAPNFVMAYVKDTSTDRRYLLRVPPTSKTLREGIAWTFGMVEKDYAPLIES